MTGLRLLFARSLGKLRMIIPMLIGVAALVLVMVFHEPISEEDYLLCKMVAHIGSVFIIMFNSIFLSVEINGNRLVRSSPISKQIRTISVPLYNTIIGVGVTAVINIVYAIFVLASGLELRHLADMLMISAPICAIYVILGTVSMQFNWGMLIMIYSYFPAMLLIPLSPDQIWESGFDVGVGTGLIVYLAAAAISVVLSFIVSHVFYKKYDFKPLQQTQQGI